MNPRVSRRLVPLLLAGALAAGSLFAEEIAVRHAEGVVRGFLRLRSPDGAVVANGDLIQTSRGDRVTSRLVFRSRTDRCRTRPPSSRSETASGW